MTPDPYIRRYCWVMATALVFGGLADLYPIAGTGTAVTLLVWLGLRQVYRSDQKASNYDARRLQAIPRRLLLDRSMDLWLANTVASGAVAVGVGLLVKPFGAIATTVWLIAAGITLGVGGVLWSSLVDWYWVLPRVSGMLGHRPCRPAPEQSARSVSWEEVTRWWLTHRIASVILVSTGFALTVGAALTLALSGASLADSARTITGAVVGGVSGIVLVFQRKAAEAAPHVTRPNTRVGSFYEHEGDVGWVVDVALEGAQLVLRRQHRRRVTTAEEANSRPTFMPEKGDTTVSLVDRLRREDRFEECKTCSGINWYCVENPRAWDKS